MNHTRINIGLFILLSGFLCASCSEEAAEAAGEHPFGKSVPLGVSSLRLEGEVATRAGGTPVTTDGAAIKVFLTNVGGYTAMYNKPYTCTGGTWSSTDPIYVDKRAGKALAVYDPNGLVSFSANSTVTTNALQARAYDETKLWYYDNTNGVGVNSTTPAVFSMIPAYARLKLSIKRHATNYVSGNCNITNVNLKNSSGSNFFVSRTLDISNGANGGSATAGGWTYALNSGNIAANATNTAYDVLVPPQPVSGNLTITLTIDGVNRAVNIPAAQFTSNALAVGRQYTIALTITDTAVTPGGNVAITDMTADGTNIKNDTPTEV